MENGPIAQFWLERTPDKREVTGSSPVRPTSIRLKVRGIGKRNKVVEIKPVSLLLNTVYPMNMGV